MAPVHPDWAFTNPKDFIMGHPTVAITTQFDLFSICTRDTFCLIIISVIALVAVQVPIVGANRQARFLWSGARGFAFDN